MRNKTIAAVTVGALAVQLLLPVASLAATNKNNGETPQKQPRGQQAMENQMERVCGSLDEQANRIAGKYGRQKQRLEEKRGQRKGELAARRTERGDRLAKNRVGYDKQHDERLALMLKKARSDEIRQAVLTFQQSLKDAQSARRATFDQAWEEYHAAVDAAITERRTALDAAASVLQSAIDEAVAAAKAACEGDEPDLKLIRQQLREVLKAAREQFKEAIKGRPDFSDTIRGLVEVRNYRFADAKVDFKTVVEQAKDELKAQLAELRPDETGSGVSAEPADTGTFNE